MTHTVSLFTDPAAVPLSLQYDSTQEVDRGLGAGWRTSWDAAFYPGTWETRLRTPAGDLLKYTVDGNGGWAPPDGSRLQLTGPTADQYHLTWPDGRVRVYQKISYEGGTGPVEAFRLTEEQDRFGNATVLSYSATDGALETVTNAFGCVLRFTYTGGHLATVTDDAGTTYQLTYDATHPDWLSNVLRVGTGDPGWTMTYEMRTLDRGTTLSPVTRPLLTRLTDPRGEQEARWDYDGKGRATLSDGPGVGINTATFTYAADGTRLVTDSLSNPTDYQIVESHAADGTLLSTEVAIDGCAACGSARQVRTYDGTHNLTSRTDANGAVTGYGGFNAWGSPGFEMRAIGTPEAQWIARTFHPVYDLPLTRSVAAPLGTVKTTWDFDDPATDVDPSTPNSQPTALIYREIVEGHTLDDTGATIPFTHITAYTYNNFAQKLSEDGPLAGPADTTRWVYCDALADEPAAAFGWDAAVECLAGTNGGKGNGNLLAVITPTGQITRYGSYDAAGRVGYAIDANGQRTDTTYDPYGRLDTLTRQEDGADYDYDPLGNLTALHLPEGNTITYTYDAGRRLTQITDALGNSIQYTYDSESHRTKEEVFDATGLLQRYEDYAYDDPNDPIDDPNRLWKTTHPDATTVTNTYDPAGNRTATTNEAGHTTTYAYDALGRLRQVTQPPPQASDPTPVTTYSYDALGNLATVTDANDHITAYAYDDAGRLLTTTSPDTGVTTYRYDAAGNLTTKTDADGITAQYTYDDGGRLTTITYPDPAYNQTFAYDEMLSTHGAGRLTSVTDASGTTRLHYDAAGRLAAEERTTAGVDFTTTYGYDKNGNRTSITYPSGRVVTTPVDGADRLAAVAMTVGTVTTPVLANVTYKPFGPMAGAVYGNGVPVTYDYDPRYRLTSLTHGSVVDRTYLPAPDGNIDAITSPLPEDPSQSFTYDALDRLTHAEQPAGYGTIDYAYDPVGNRTALGGAPYTYEAGTNRLATTPAGAYTTSAAGNIETTPDHTFTYDPTGRVATADGATTYGYDYRGLRVIKTAATATILYAYDPDGHLLTESDGAGHVAKEYLWAGDQLVAVLTAGGTPDSDGDGLLDTWELQYFGSLAPLPTDDPDNDALDNLAEQVAGLDPTNPDTDGDGVTDGIDPDPTIANYHDGNVGPVGALNGQVDTGDLVVLMRMAAGMVSPAPLDVLHGDLAPAGAPDGVIDWHDVSALLGQLSGH